MGLRRRDSGCATAVFPNYSQLRHTLSCRKPHSSLLLLSLPSSTMHRCHIRRRRSAPLALPPLLQRLPRRLMHYDANCVEGRRPPTASSSKRKLASSKHRARTSRSERRSPSHRGHKRSGQVSSSPKKAKDRHSGRRGRDSRSRDTWHHYRASVASRSKQVNRRDFSRTRAHVVLAPGPGDNTPHPPPMPPVAHPQQFRPHAPHLSPQAPLSCVTACTVDSVQHGHIRRAAYTATCTPWI